MLSPLRSVVLTAVATGFLVASWCQEQEDAGGNPAAVSEPASASAAFSIPESVLPSVAALPNPFATMHPAWGELPDGREWVQVSAVDIDRDGRHVWMDAPAG